MAEAVLEKILRRDRLVVAAALGALTAVAWVYVLWLAHDMDMGGMDMTGMRMLSTALGLMLPASAPWRLSEFAFVLVMWLVMMVGMMAPSAAPMILTYARAGRQSAAADAPFASTGGFVAGYFLAWLGFCLVATLLQWALERLALLDAHMASASRTLGGVVWLAAGVYQWTPLKDVCLSQCQTPFGFLLRHGGARRDLLGSMRLGLKHGAHCVGCCWALMALLFVVGVMNVLWIALLALLVLVEKVTPHGRLIARFAGAAFVGAGAYLLGRA